MRQKTDAKRQQILQIASELFMQNGFESVSMSQIAAKVGGSKSTLYNYFQNKEELFIDVSLYFMDQMAENASKDLDQSLPLFDKLRALGKNHLRFILSDDSIALYRNILIYPHLGEMAGKAHASVMQSLFGNMANLIEEAMTMGIIKKADPWLATMQLRSLFELDLMDLRMLNLEKSIDEERIEKNIENGLVIFCSHYKI